MTLGERIRYERKARNWTQADLASRVGGVTAAYISMLEAGKRDDPSRDILRRFAAAFNLSVAELEGEPDVVAGAFPAGQLRAEGLPEYYLLRYENLWKDLSRPDRVSLLGHLRIVADAERRLQALEAAAREAADGDLPAGTEGPTILAHLIVQS